MEIKHYFKNYSQRLEEMKKQKELLSVSCPFGISYLDRALDGISCNDLIILSSRTGVGKTEACAQIARANINAGKNVYWFALEAYGGEMELRIKFNLLSEAYYADDHKKETNETPNFTKWVKGKQNHIFRSYEPTVDKLMSYEMQNLFTAYRDETLTVDDFVKETQRIRESADLIIVDHLHYFDYDLNEPESVALKKTIKTIRDLVLCLNKPVILACHLRKSDKKAKTLIPDIDDIHGTSDISKMATKAIIIAPHRKAWKPQYPHYHPTFFRIAKSRDNGQATRYVGVVDFNGQTNSYEKDFKIGELSYDETEFTQLEWESQWPSYLKE